MTPEREAALETMSSLPDTEVAEAQKADASGIPSGNPETNAGRLMAEFLHANTIIRNFAQRQGVVLDAESEANLERRYQEQALNQYAKAEASMLGFPQVFSRAQAFRTALKDTSRMANTAGTLRGRVESTEIETEEGTRMRPEVERAPEVDAEAQRRVSVLDFLDQFNSKPQREAAMNIIADTRGFPRVTKGESAARAKWEADPDFKAIVEAFAQSIDLTRDSLASVIQSPLSIADVQAALDRILPNSTQVRIVEQSSLVNVDGIPVRGQYRPDEAQPFILNASFLGSEADVKAALYEELIHGVWNDPEVQAEWSAVKQSLTTEDLAAVEQYPPAEREEEAAVRKVIASKGQPDGWFNRMLRAILGAFKRVFGIEDPSVNYERIFERALLQRSAGGPRRNSLAQGVWKNLKEVTEEAAAAGDPVAIRAAAAAQGTVVPQSIFGEIKLLGTTGEQLVAKRLLKSVVDAAAMGHDLVSQFSAIGPSGIPLSSGLTVGAANAKDIAAEAILKQHLRFQQISQKAETMAERTSAELDEALNRIPEKMIAQNSADLYRGMADQLASDYNQYLTNQALTLKSGAFDPEMQEEITRASFRVTEGYRGVGNAVAQGLRNIAKEIPVGVLGSAESVRAWIDQRLNDSTKSRILSDEARDWLFSEIGRQKAPIDKDERIHLRLAAVKDLASDDAKAKADMIAFQKGFSKGGKKVGVKSFAKRWAEMRTEYADQLATAREIDRTIKRLDANFAGAERAKDIIDRLLADPEYQAKVDEAVSALSAGSNIRQYEVGANGRYTGRVLYLNPKTQEPVAIDLQPDFGKEAQNIIAIRTLLQDVKEWMGSTDDRVTRAAWDKEAEWLRLYAFGASDPLVTGSFIGGYRIPSFFQIQPFGREFWQGRMDVRGPAYQRIGTRLVQGAQQAGMVYGQVDREIRRIDDEFSPFIKDSAAKAVKSHGWDPTRSVVLEEWVPKVLEPIVSQYQNPSAQPYKVGDYLSPGIQVTKEDIAAAQALKARDNKIFDVLQKESKDGAIPLLYFNPLQTSEEFAGRVLNRRSVDYGLKMPRRPLSRQNERGNTFTTDWIQSANGIEKRKLLDENFDWVLMGQGLIGNTDQEFKIQLNPQDAALFSDLKEMQRNGTLPFTDLQGLIDWAGDQLSTPEIDAATAAADFELRLIGYVDRISRNFNKALELIPSNIKKLFERLNIPRGVIDTVGVGESPFLTPRGQLVAPPSFYKYTSLDDQSWGALTAGIRTVLTLREMEAVSAAKAAIDKEVEKYESKQDGVIVNLQKKLKQSKATTFGPFSAKKRIARSSRAAADKGDVMYDYLTLKQNQRTLTILLAELERLGREHVTMPEDNEAIQMVRSVRETVTSSLLQSMVSVFNNIFGGTISNTSYRRGLGKASFMLTPPEMLGQAAKYITGGILSKLMKVRGVDPAVKALLKTPGFKKIVSLLVEQQLRFEQDRAKAIAARTVDPQSSKDKAAAARLFPETYGRLTEQDPGPFTSFINTLLALTPGVARGMEASKSVFPGAFDRMINQNTTSLTSGWVDEISNATMEAWKARDTGVDGWDDLSQPMNKFTHKDLGLPGKTQLNWWRNMLSPVGSLEAISLDHYKRSKSGTPTPLLTDAQSNQVAQEIARMTNMSDATGTPTLFQGRGWSGEARKSLFMLLRYPVNFAAVQENLYGKNYGDNSTPAKQWRTMSAAVMALLAVLLSSIGSEFGQESRQMITGDPRTRASIATVLDDPTLADLAKYSAISISSILPFFGERVAQAFGGTSSRPMLDATRMFAPFSVANDIENTVLKMVQTGDMSYPLLDLTRRYIPLSGVAINPMVSGEVDLREAARGLRLAAPSDIELRPQGGGGTSRQTPQTPLIRRAVDQAMAGDRAGSQETLEEAIKLQVEAGKTQSEARSAVAAAFQSRDPERSTVGRPLTADERRRTLSRMSPSQRQSYLKSRQVFGRPLLKGRASALARRRKRRKTLKPRKLTSF